MSSKNNDKYWATLPPDEEYGIALSDILSDYSDSDTYSARSGLVWRAYQYYYSIDNAGMHASSRVLRGGEQGELAKIRVNHARALVKTLLNLVTSQRFTWDPKAVNTDAESLKEVRKARSLLEFYWHELNIENKANRAVEQALGPGAGEGFTHVEWDEGAGDEYLPDPMTGEITKSGDVSVSLVSTWDVFRDRYAKSFDESNWVIVRRYKNRWDVAAKYGKDEKVREAILAQPVASVNSSGAAIDPRRDDSELVECYYFYHRRTPALPKGRESVFLADGTLLEDYGGLRLSKWPLQRMAAAEIDDSPFPYSAYLEVLGIQELYDSLHTTVASNQTAFGTQYVIITKTSELSPTDLDSGIRTISVDSMQDAPAPLQLAKTAPEIFQYMETLKSQQELIFGLNNVVRGQPQSGEQSGAALALLQSQALQQSGDVQKNYYHFVQELGECVFEMLNTHLSAPRQIAIIGQANESLVEPFDMSRGSFSRVKRIQVELMNPVAQSAPMRLDMANNLLQMGLVKTPEQYMTVMESGRLEPVSRALSDELILIEDENEQLQNGNLPPVLMLDDHPLHAREHRRLLASTLARGDPDLVQRVLAHITEHERLFYTAPPTTLALVGINPPPPQMLPPGMAPPGAPPMDGSQGGGSPPGPPPGPPGNPAAGSATPPLPTNPATGQQWDAATGGGVIPPA